MKAVFIESGPFTKRIADLLSDDEYASLQRALMQLPDKGAVIQSCNGLRKVRSADPKRNKGTRGGARVIYLHVPEANWFFMVGIYGKDEKHDLSAAEKKELSKLVSELKRQAASSIRHNSRKKQ